jgi:CBS-domain-containing membrane protein
MTPVEKMVTAGKDTTLQQANDIIWDNKLNTLPIIDDEGRLLYMVFRKDYATHKEYPLELLDGRNAMWSVPVLIPEIMLSVFLPWLKQVQTCCA